MSKYLTIGVLQHSQNMRRAFVMTINTELAGSAPDTFILPAYKINEITVDWGDGTSDSYTISGDKTHVYTNPGIYNITIEGSGSTPIRFASTGDRSKITAILSWGNLQWQNAMNSFYGCNNLAFIPDSPLTGFARCDDYTNMFYNCINLEIKFPDRFFKEREDSGLTAHLQRTFTNTKMYGELTEHYANITGNNMIGTFQNTNVSGQLPRNLFQNKGILGASFCFSGCIHLYGSFPRFTGNIASSLNLQGTFYNTRNLHFEGDEFDEATLLKITSLQGTFRVSDPIYSHTGAVQEIWNVATPTTKANCFLNNTALDNYSDIPNDWKGL